MSCLKKLHRSFIYFLSTVLPSVVSSLTPTHEFSPSLSLIPKQHSNCSFTYSAMPSPLLLCLSFLQSLCPSVRDVLLNPQELKNSGHEFAESVLGHQLALALTIGCVAQTASRSGGGCCMQINVPGLLVQLVRKRSVGGTILKTFTQSTDAAI